LANPKSTVIGVLILGCLVAGIFYPGMEIICQKAVEGLIALGFIATADGATLQKALLGLSDKMRSTSKALGVVALCLIVPMIGGCGMLQSKAEGGTFADSVISIRAACNDPEVMARLDNEKDLEAVSTIKRICQAVK
jgi:hypothetical protein